MRSNHIVLLNGRSFMQTRVQSGVKQGCPLSMTIFIICVDPIVRYMASRLDPLGANIRAYCNDLAITVARLAAALDV